MPTKRRLGLIWEEKVICGTERDGRGAPHGIVPCAVRLRFSGTVTPVRAVPEGEAYFQLNGVRTHMFPSVRGRVGADPMETQPGFPRGREAVLGTAPTLELRVRDLEHPVRDPEL